MRREQELPHGLRGFAGGPAQRGRRSRLLGAVPRSGAWWTRRCRPGPTVALLLDPRRSGLAGTGALTPLPVHPLLGAHVRLPEEPERHAWQAEVGTAAQPWLDDHQIHNVAALPGAAYCEMALAAARTVLGEASEVRDIRFEQMLLLDEETPVAAVASVEAPGVVNFVVETDQRGRRSVGGPPRSCTPSRMTTSPPRTT